MQRHRIVDLLLRANGVGVLEQLVVLDAAAELATHKGLTITQADIDREYDGALRKLVDPFSGASSGNFDRESAERTLESVLAQRNISREEFRLGMRRHAYLRRIVESELTFTREQLQAELQRRYGPRLEVRHIQLASPRSAARIRARLANGEDFAQLAREHSANLISAEAGGLLQPFSDKDDALPALFRRTASSLKAGEISEAVRVGEWYHLIKLERRIEAKPVELEPIRGELTQSLLERLSDPAMEKLYERLFREAKIEIHDLVLDEAFRKVHADRSR